MRDKWPTGYSRFEFLANEIDFIYFDKKPEQETIVFGNEYTNALNKDLLHKLQCLSEMVTYFPGSSEIASYTVTGDYQAAAYMKLENNGRPHYYISNGMVLALDDFFLKLMCDKGFFGFEYRTGTSEVPEINCIYPTHCGYLLPVERYDNYTKFEDREFFIKLHNLKVRPLPSQLSIFFEAIPLLDEERLQTAAMMTDIAIMWIMLHEESHFMLGHAHYFEKQHNISTINEVGSTYNSDIDPNIKRWMEWDADRRAAKLIAELFKKFDIFNFDLPKYCKQPAWHLRLLMISIGCATLLFERSKFINGDTNNYPSNRTRLLTTMRACYVYFIENAESISMEFNGIEILSAIWGTLSDILIASKAISKHGNFTGRFSDITTFPNLNQNDPINYFNDHNELRVFFESFYINKDDLSAIDSEVYKLWLKEMIEFDKEFDKYDAFFRDFRDSALKTLQDLATKD